MAKGEKTEGMELIERVSGIAQDTVSQGDWFPKGTHLAFLNGWPGSTIVPFTIKTRTAPHGAQCAVGTPSLPDRLYRDLPMLPELGQNHECQAGEDGQAGRGSSRRDVFPGEHQGSNSGRKERLQVDVDCHDIG